MNFILTNPITTTIIKLTMCLFFLGLLNGIFHIDHILVSDKSIAYKTGVVVSYAIQFFGTLLVLRYLFQKKIVKKRFAL